MKRLARTYIDEQDTLNAYQRAAGFWRNPSETEVLVKDALGLAGEVGEVVELIKKHRFHGLPLDVERVKSELGDVLWYLADLASECGLPLCDVAHANVQKLSTRYPHGFVLGGGIRKEGE